MSFKCPECKNSKTEIIDSRPHKDEVRRRRSCPECKTRFSTYERIIGSARPLRPPKVIHATHSPVKTPVKTKKRKPIPYKPKQKDDVDVNQMSSKEFEDFFFSENYRFDDDEI